MYWRGRINGRFYAHFDRKDALVAATCALLAGVDAVIARYLSTAHRDDPAGSCVLPALSEEVARGAPEVRHAFTGAFKDYFARLTPFLQDASAPEREAHELVLAAGMAGAVMLARAVDAPDLSLRILQTCRAFYTHALAEPAHLPERRRKAFATPPWCAACVIPRHALRV